MKTYEFHSEIFTSNPVQDRDAGSYLPLLQWSLSESIFNEQQTKQRNRFQTYDFYVTKDCGEGNAFRIDCCSCLETKDCEWPQLASCWWNDRNKNGTYSASRSILIIYSKL